MNKYGGVTDYRNILTYKQNSIDFVLGHELGHIFQLCLSPSEKVRDLYYRDTEFIANAIGLEVEEKNYKVILEQNTIKKPHEVNHTNPEPVEEEKSSQQDTQQPGNFLSNIIFPAIKSIIDSISSFFSWLFGSKEEEQSDNNLSLLELNVDDNIAENFTNNHHLSDHYNSHDELI